MPEPMTKAKLLELLKASRANWDVALAPIPAERLTEPQAIDNWAIKDHITHLTYYESWCADRIDEALHGLVYTPVPMDAMHWDERNPLIYEQHRNDPLDQVLAQSKAAHEKLLKGVQAQSEEFLTQPQTFEGAPYPMIIWEMLQGDVYEHYNEHAGWVRDWWAAQKK